LRVRAADRCLWCGREIAIAGTVGRRRRYCAQACRQRAYENRTALQRGELPADAVVLTVAERDDLVDRLYQVRCAAEDVATALDESADDAELATLVSELLTAARLAERLR
jgi:Lon protease-like protein